MKIQDDPEGFFYQTVDFSKMDLSGITTGLYLMDITHLGHSACAWLLVTDTALVSGLVAQCERVFHLAAAVGVKYVLENPLRSLLTNIRGTEVVLEAADAHRRKVIVFSSSEVYGKGVSVPFGQGDSQMKEILQFLKQKRSSVRARIDCDYPGTGSSVDEVQKCVDYVKAALA